MQPEAQDDDFAEDFGGDFGEDAMVAPPPAAQPRGVGELIAQLPDLSFMLQHSMRTQ